LAMEPREKNLLKNKWKKGKHFIDFIMVQRMFIMAGSMMLGAFFIFRHYLDFDFSKALTMSLTTLAIFQWFNAWNCRSENESIFRRNPFSNKWLLFMMPVVVSLQLLAVYHPTMQKILRTTALEPSDWLIAAVFAFSIIILEEIRKFLYNILYDKTGRA
jgi:Ca2+-transporting ATPase